MHNGSMQLIVAALVFLSACGGDPTTNPPDAGEPTGVALLAKLASCTIIGGKYQPDASVAATIDICGTSGAVFWKADLDIDCNGRSSAKCNLQADPTYLNQTAASDSNGEPLDAAALPYVVFPSPTMRFDYRARELAMGSVVAVIYQDHVEYGVAGDTGPTAIIGEASYRMAELLGIDPDPTTGGAGDGVTYIAFTGADAMVHVVEDHAEAVRVGIAHAKAFLSLP